MVEEGINSLYDIQQYDEKEWWDSSQYRSALPGEAHPKEIRESYCVHCGHPKHYCACMMRYCPKCQRETMQHETLVGKVEAEHGTVVLASMIGMRTYAWRCHECDHVHSA